MTNIILQIETATPSCSVALSQNGVPLSARAINQRNIHAEVITVFIGQILAENHLSFNQLDAVAVSSGPGSYTGLRIGVSTAKGLCFALDKPLIAVNTLLSMAAGYKNRFQAISGNFLLCPMIDARRMEVYTALFDNDLLAVKETSAEIISAESFAAELDQQKIFFFGDGAPKCKETLGSHPNAVFTDTFYNDAADMTALALQKLRDQQFENVAYFEPFYLKDFIAGKIKD